MNYNTGTLGALCRFIDYRGKTPQKTTEGIPLVTAKIIKNGIIQKPEEFIAEDEYDLWMRRGIPKKGSVIMTTEAPLGEVAQLCTDEKMAFAQRVIILEPDENELDPSYLYYALRDNGLMDKIKARESGTTVTGIKSAELKKVEISYPSMDVQRKIVAILKPIDDVITNNIKINDNLAQQAQAVFLRMFADNESVIPATIADVALNVTDGVHNTVHDDPEGEYFLLSCKNIKGGSLSIGTSERRINLETFEKLRRRTKLSRGDVLISSVGTVGELLILNEEPSNYEFQRSVAIVKPNIKVVSPAYMYESLVSQKAELINAAHGAVQQCLFISDIANFPIGIPTLEDLQTFDEIVTPMFNAITANEAETMRLVVLRDTLLPRLMSGEIDVSQITI